MIIFSLNFYFEYQKEQNRIEALRFVGTWDVIGSMGGTDISLRTWIFYENLSLKIIEEDSTDPSPSISFSIDQDENTITVTDIEETAYIASSADWGKYKIENDKLCIYGFEEYVKNGDFDYFFSNGESIVELEPDFSSYYYFYGTITMTKKQEQISIDDEGLQWSNVNITIIGADDFNWDDIKLTRSLTYYYGNNAPLEWGQIAVDDQIYIDENEINIYVKMTWLSTGSSLGAWFFPISTESITPSLVGYWDFEEGSENIAYDKSGNENHGTIYGATWTEGVKGKAVSFDGINDYIHILYNQSLAPEEYSVILWYKAKGYKVGEMIAKGNSKLFYQIQFGRDLNPKNVIEFWYEDRYDNDYYIYSELGYEINQWFRAAMVFRDGTLTAYIDDEKVGEKYFGITPYDNFLGVTIGKGDTGYFNGIIDEVRIYNCALTLNEINNLGN